VNETTVTVTGNVAGDVIARRVGSNGEHLLVTFRVASSERRWAPRTSPSVMSCSPVLRCSARSWWAGQGRAVVVRGCRRDPARAPRP